MVVGMEAGASPDESGRLLAVARRALVETSPSLTNGDLAEFRHETVTVAAHWAAQAHRRGELIAVNVDGEMLMPRFQFDERFTLRPEVAEVTHRLRAASMDDWALWRWYWAHNPWIGRSPVDLLNSADDQSQLLRLADELAARK